jgi:hypothetical protein
LCSTPSYFRVRMNQLYETAHLYESHEKALILRCIHFGPGFPIRVSLSCSDDASSAHSWCSHDSQLAASPHRICRLSAFWPAFPIDVQSLQEGQCYRTLTLSVRDCTSHRLLSYQGIATLSSIPRSTRFRTNGSHRIRTNVLERQRKRWSNLAEFLRDM